MSGRGRLPWLALALVPTLAGGTLAYRGWERRPLVDAEMGSLHLRLERAGWVAHEGHDLATPMPPQMAPGLPARGMARLSLELTLVNTGSQPARFSPAELALHRERGASWWRPLRAVHTERVSAPSAEEELVVPAGLAFTHVTELEAPEDAGELWLVWGRGGAQAALLPLRAPAREKPAQLPEVWPETAQQLPTASASAGATLFRGKLGCAACHGAKERPGTETVGPSLTHFAQRVRARGATLTPAELAYRAVLDPNAEIAPHCARGQPCAIPSAMPAYGELLSAQEMADLIAFVVQDVKESP